MIAALDVGSVYEKETDYGTQVSADEAGRESFFGNGTKNARTEFNVSSADAATEISAAIDHYLNIVPPQVTNALVAVADVASSASLNNGRDPLKVGQAIHEAKSVF